MRILYRHFELAEGIGFAQKPNQVEAYLLFLVTVSIKVVFSLAELSGIRIGNMKGMSEFQAAVRTLPS